MIFPSSLFESSDGESSDFYNKSFNNSLLRIGIVLAVYDIEDEGNILKISPEYDVLTIEQDTHMGMNTSIYKNCLMMDKLGGVADYFQFKLRPVKDQLKTRLNADFASETGSIVLVLCLDGISEKALIIGGMQNPSKPVLTKEKGLHLEGEYNGINYKINKDGEFTVTFRSATEDDGTPKNKEAGGSFLKIDKTGSIELNDNNKESIRIDKTNKTIAVNAEKDISISTEANANITSKANTSITAKDIVAKAEGKVTFTSASASMFKSDAEITIDAPSINLKGQDMIKAEAGQIQLLGNQVMVGNGAAPAVTNATLFIGTGNLGGPVVCQAVGPFSASVMIGA
jgi:hypothetical protein